MTPFKFRRYGAFLLSSLFLSLLLSSVPPAGQAFAHTSSVTSTTASAQSLAPSEVCYEESCNGQYAGSYPGCIDPTQRLSFRNADVPILGPNQQQIGSMRLWRSGSCYAFYGVVLSTMRDQNGSIVALPLYTLIERLGRIDQSVLGPYSTGPTTTTALYSGMVGWRFAPQSDTIVFLAFIYFNGQWYSAQDIWSAP